MDEPVFRLEMEGIKRAYSWACLLLAPIFVIELLFREGGKEGGKLNYYALSFHEKEKDDERAALRWLSGELY